MTAPANQADTKRPWHAAIARIWSGRGGVTLAQRDRSHLEHALPATVVPPETGAACPPSERLLDHLVVMVNGLFGSRKNWIVISKLLEQHLDPHSTVLHVSGSNEFFQTYEGIDVCGRRLAEEVLEVVASTPSLQRISVVGHSMGGLVSRAALGELFDPESGTVAGLRPTHYVSLATPHLGCTTDPGPAQVPLLSWSQRVPGLHRALSGMTRPVTAAALGRTGRQFFLLDSDGGRPPLLHRLARDEPEPGLRYLSALRSFETRTCYANSSGDHLVGWANSSMRRVEELPRLKARGKGVVREDPLEAAWAPEARPRLRRQSATARQADPGGAHTLPVAAVVWASSAEALVGRDATEVAGDAGLGGNGQGAGSAPCTARDGSTSCRQAVGVSSSPDAAEYILSSLDSLQLLPWRRVDVCFRGTPLPLLAHQHLQVQRKYINWAGMATAKHLAMQLAAMDELREGGRGAVAAAGATQPGQGAASN